MCILNPKVYFIVVYVQDGDEYEVEQCNQVNTIVNLEPMIWSTILAVIDISYDINLILDFVTSHLNFLQEDGVLPSFLPFNVNQTV